MWSKFERGDTEKHRSKPGKGDASWSSVEAHPIARIARWNPRLSEGAWPGPHYSAKVKFTGTFTVERTGTPKSVAGFIRM